MSLVRSQTKKTKLSPKEILHEFQWFIILVALIFTSVGFLIDTLQLLSAFKWMSSDISDENRLIYIIQNNYAVLINILVIASFGYLIYLLSRKQIKVVHATLWYAILVSLNTTIPYFWITQNHEAVAGYLWRDYVMFTIVVFVVSTCTFGKFVYQVAIYGVLMSLVIALLSGNAFLQENIPMLLFTLIGFAFCLWKKDTLLQKIVSKQSKEKQLIEELSLFKEKMNSMLFHDIKVPLNSIIKQANSLSKETNTSQISLQAEKVKRMLSNMLDIASSNDARLEVSLTGFKLSELLEKVTQKTLYSIYNKDIIIEYTSGNYDFELFGDRDLIERALINVVDNAVKYSPVNGKISIISLSENNKLTIRILDQGPGVKEEEKNEIFNLFYSSAHQPNVQKSSGIGLAFCKMVVEAHNGTIRLNSPEDGGSEFIFTLPVVKSKTETASNNSHLVNKKYSEELRSEINNILPKLRQLNYYQTSEIYSLVSSINRNSNEKKCELEEIMTKALSCNPRFYADLINELS